MTLYSGDTFEHAGAEFRVTHEHDGQNGAPWEGEGHGAVSEWIRGYVETPRDCWVLVSERGAKRFYNWRETLELAKAESWGMEPAGVAQLAQRLGRTPTPRDIRKAAVRADFEFLQGYCEGAWHYVGVIVELLDKDGEATGEANSLWGIESNADDYLDEVARDLAREITDGIGAAKDCAMACAD
jgi:hypothetical protein